VTRWEYKLVPIGGKASTSPGLSMLRAAGAEGWEAVGLELGHVLCKRPAPIVPVVRTDL
jgi:hypothetical protein